MRTRIPYQAAFCTLILFGWASAHTAFGRTLYVNANTPINPPPDGLSWATAWPGVMQAMTNAADGDEIWVAAGLYQENIDLKAGVALYGGFAGTEIRLESRNWTNYPATLDGQGKRSVVTVAPGATNTTRIDGFIITNGVGTKSFGYGGGILCITSSPVVANNTITKNWASYGGGIYCKRSSAVITNNVISYNNDISIPQGYQTEGGGILSDFSSARILRNIIVGNKVSNGGGGVCIWDGTDLIQDNWIIGNRAGAIGAGINCLSASPAILNNRIIGNVLNDTMKTFGGGGISCWYGAHPLIANNVLMLNSVINGIMLGGGIFCGRESNPIINNNTLIANQANRGAGIFCGTNTVTIVNNLIAFGGPGIQAGSNAVIQFNCLFENSGTNYQDLPDPTGLNGNISADPLLQTSASYPGFYLRAGSPCIDAGDSAAIQSVWMDIDGEPRSLGNQVDIGADEFNGTTPDFLPAIVRVSPQGNDASDGSTWASAKRTIQVAVDQAALTGGEVWVRAGTYVERLNLRHRVYLYGGFQGGETTRSERDWTQNPSIIDGARGGSVVTISGLADWTSLDGFTICNGQSKMGGGIYCEWSSPVIANNQVVSNQYVPGGSGGSGDGGGILCTNTSNPVISNNVVAFNRATCGGGIKAHGCAPLLLNNIVSSNTAFNSGGGMYLISTKATVANNLMAGNLVTNNSASLKGAAIYLNSASSNLIANNTLVENRLFKSTGEDLVGGAISCASDKTLLVNNIVVQGSVGISVSAGVPLIRNNCVFGNSQTNYYGIVDPTGTIGNISVDPLLAADSYRLMDGSPCIDAGDDASAVLGWTDLAGHPRLQGAHVDMGAYEYSVSDQWLPMAITAGMLAARIEQVGGMVYVQYEITFSDSGWRLAGVDFTQDQSSGMVLAFKTERRIGITLPAVQVVYGAWPLGSLLPGNYSLVCRSLTGDLMSLPFSVSATTSTLLSANRLADQRFQVQVTATTNLAYLVQASTNLIDWFAICTNRSGNFEFIDEDCQKFPQRYYQVVIKP